MRPDMMSRRRLLRLVVSAGSVIPLGALLGCTRRPAPETGAPLDAVASPRAMPTAAGSATGAAASPTPSRTATSSPTPRATPSRTATSSPTATSTPTGLAIELLPATLGIGEAIRVRVVAAGAAGGVMRFVGREYPLVVRADGSLWGIVGAALDASPAAAAPLAIEAIGAAGVRLGTGTTGVAIVAVPRPVEELQVTEEQSAVLGGDAGPREAAIRETQFSTFDAAPPKWTGLFLRPTEGPVTTAFGQARSINGGPVGPGHTGTDLASDAGTPVRLAAAGRVTWAGEMPIRGNAVLVDHGGGVKSGYHHLSAINVAVGDIVLPAGTILGAVGSTGFATGPHLHWEVTVWGVNVDAMTWLTVPFGS
jgi:murein DD-endopeptidase MepM/ murein hydrolase activator NlpD